MLRIFLFAIVTSLSVLSEAQTYELFREDFNNNYAAWTEMNTADATSKVANGVYAMSHTRNNTSWRFWQTVRLSEDKDFYIEASMKQVSGPDNFGYGLIWASNYWDNSFNFLISSNGDFSLYVYRKEQYFQLVDWTKISGVKEIGKYNVLRVWRKKDQLHFLVNGKEVFKMKCPPFMGMNHGFVLQSNIEVAADYFSIFQQPEAINLIDNAVNGYKRENMGDGINTAVSEIAPVISPDGKTLYFGTTNPNSNSGPLGTYDVWFSELIADGTWSKAQRMPSPINNDGDNLVISVSPDGNTLLLEGLYNAQGGTISDEGISISHRTKSGWSVPQKITIKNYYNRNEYESFCPSADGKVLILSVERDETIGNKDLYVSFRNNDGSFTEPKNMGNVLNTFGNEGTPFLAPDGKTLFFYSDTHNGFGSADIFMSKRLDETWLKWSEPKNLGPEMNTKNWDTYYSISAQSSYAFLVSSENSIGNEDIFMIKIPESIKSDPVVLISGKVLDANTKQPIEAEIRYENLANGKEMGIARTNPRTGEYKIILPYGINYGFRAESKGYVADNENIDLKKTGNYNEIIKNMYLKPIAVGETFALNNLFFIQNSSTLIETSHPELNRLVEFLKSNPSIEILLEGHTETGGKPENLIKLSEERVEVVRLYLIGKGIAATRITGKGYGGTKPIVASGTDQSANRRVEFKIMKK